MSIKITSPIEGFTGKSVFGPTTVAFTDGVAEIEDLSQPLRAYLETKGYSLESVQVGPFDPAAHNAADVLAYLGLTEGHQPPTAVEHARVVAAERDGKARKGILDAVEKATSEAKAKEEADAEEAAAQAAAAQAALDAQGQGGDGA